VCILEVGCGSGGILPPPNLFTALRIVPQSTACGCVATKGSSNLANIRAVCTVCDAEPTPR